MNRSSLAFIVGLLISASVVAPASAQIVISQLSHGALLGHSVSAAQLVERVSDNRLRVAQAARQLGLNPKETEDLMHAIAARDLQWVEIPRHLDGMAWLRREHVLVLRDVIIPADTHGWEIDLDSKFGRIKAYLPQECGNLSIIRSTEVLGASVVVPVQKHTFPAPLAARCEAPHYPPVEAPVAAAFTPQLPSIITPTIARRSRFPWLLLLPIGFLLIHGPSSSPGPIAAVPPPGTFVCWEEPLAHCDAPQATIRHR